MDDHLKPDIDIFILFRELKKYFVKIILFTIICAFSSFFYSFSIPNSYTASVIMEISDNKPSLSSSLPQGLGSSLGFLPANQLSLNADIEQVLQKFRTRDFIIGLTEEQKFLPLLLGLKEYDEDSKIETYDSDLVDKENLEWIGPSIEELTFFYLNKKYRSAIQTSYDSPSQLLTLSVTSPSPIAALELVKIIKQKFNDIAKKEDLYEANKSIEFLQEKLLETTQNDIRRAMSQLIESQLSTVMLANVQDEYLLKTFDDVYLPEYKSKPKRLTILIIGTFSGLILSLLIAILAIYRTRLI